MLINTSRKQESQTKYLTNLKTHVCVGLLSAGSVEAHLHTVGLFLPEPEPVINRVNSVPLKDKRMWGGKKTPKNTGSRSFIWSEGQEQTDRQQEQL